MTAVTRFVVIVTGSRHDSESVEREVSRRLEKYPPGTFVYHGACPVGEGGADGVADRVSPKLGHRVERVPVRPGESFLARNTRLVNAAAETAQELDAKLVCEAFPGPDSRGTWDTLKKAVRKGAPGHVTGVDK